jgi:hypothetical protein
MSGKAIIVLVTGVIIITGTIMFNIEAASTRIVKNYTDYYMRQNTQNIAQSGVNLAITQIGKNRKWRAGYTDLPLVDGKVNVLVYDTKFDSIPVVAVKSVAETDYGNNQKRRDTSVAYLFWAKKQYPVAVRGLMTLNADANVNGSATFDARDHDINGNLIAGSGVPAVWTTGSAFTVVSGAANVGGTDAGIDYAPTNPGNPAVIKLNQVYAGGFPQTPDAVFGGFDSTFTEGTLKAIAQSGYAGSQYATDPNKLKYPLTGVTYVELPTTTPKNEWSSASIRGEGILVVHNSSGNAILKNSDDKFTGIIIADDVVHLHGELIGGLIALKNALSGNVIGNGSANLKFSRQAIVSATRFLENEGKPSILAWWE